MCLRNSFHQLGAFTSSDTEMKGQALSWSGEVSFSVGWGYGCQVTICPSPFSNLKAVVDLLQDHGRIQDPISISLFKNETSCAWWSCLQSQLLGRWRQGRLWFKASTAKSESPLPGQQWAGWGVCSYARCTVGGSWSKASPGQKNKKTKTTTTTTKNRRP
jgi:hypothetical protein